MENFLFVSSYWGFVLTLASYWLALKLSKRLKLTIFNPILVSSLIIICLLLLFKIDYSSYSGSAKYLNYFLTPATVCLAYPMYQQFALLKNHAAAILLSIFSGCLACAVTIFLLSRLFGLSPEVYYSLQPKSVTTAIALGISEEMAGNASITAIAVVITGLLGAMLASSICRICKITHPVAIGLACGNSAHAIGTSKALEFGEVQGAMSSLSIVIAGVMTVIIIPLFAGFY